MGQKRMGLMGLGVGGASRGGGGLGVAVGICISQWAGAAATLVKWVLTDGVVQMGMGKRAKKSRRSIWGNVGASDMRE
jgi:hypothetical protein